MTCWEKSITASWVQTHGGVGLQDTCISLRLGLTWVRRCCVVWVLVLEMDSKLSEVELWPVDAGSPIAEELLMSAVAEWGLFGSKPQSPPHVCHGNKARGEKTPKRGKKNGVEDLVVVVFFQTSCSQNDNEITVKQREKEREMWKQS